jgi:dienelactone hydrolase
VVGKEIPYTVDGRTFEGYLAYDAKVSGPRPGVLVVHEWWGHGDYVRMRARMLAELGYAAFALDMYGDGKVAEHPDDAKKFMLEVMSNVAGAVKRFQAARELLAKQPTTDPDQISAIGYCFGGAVVLHMARAGHDLDGVASFHGNLATQAPAKKGGVKAKVLVLHGAADAMAPPEQVEAFKKEMSAAGVDLQFQAYAGAKHAFTNPDATAVGEKFGMPLAYDESADRQSWAELRTFLEELYPPGG